MTSDNSSITWCFQDVVGKYIPAGVNYSNAEQIARDYKIDVPNDVNKQEYIKAYILANLVVL